MANVKLGAYFYPNTTTCPIKNERAQQKGYLVLNESWLAQQATPRFEGHIVPKTYCLGTPEITIWDDANIPTMVRQIELAQKFGIDFFIFDTFMGNREGKFVHEMSKPLDKAFLGTAEGRNMKFGLMLIPEGPRVVLPAPPEGPDETGREYDDPVTSARNVIDILVKYWEKPNYFRIDERPYLSIFLQQLTITEEKRKYVKEFTQELLEYSDQRYRINPYLVGVVRKQPAASFLVSLGAEALTGYANLPEFDSGHKPIQVYENQLALKRKEWENMRTITNIPLVPAAVVGWDATSRGEPNIPLEMVQGQYPFTPIVVGGSPELFGTMLYDTLQFVTRTVPEKERYGIICAWNEMTEYNALLPTVTEGVVDFSYLEQVKKVKDKIVLESVIERK